MKTIGAVLVFLLLCMAAWGACGETVTACGITVDLMAEEIDFGSVKVTDVDALTQLLDRMPNLRRADMYESSLKRAQMDMLFTRYPQITFGWTYKVGDHIVRTDMEAFSTLHGRSPDPIHSEKDFEWLKFCKNLKAIDVGHNWVEDLEWVRHFPQLRVLIIGVNHVSDITPLADLTQLEYLEMFTNVVTDLTPLTGLKNLRDLNIKNNPIRDISPLYEMTWLERLWLRRNEKRVSQQELDRLFESLPDCEFDVVNHPTGGTWREHPRYFVIYEMFHGTRYIPFEE